MLNRALRLMDVGIMIKLGFFIGDLHRHIEELHNKQFGGHNASTSFTVYRGQGMTKEDFKKMTETNSCLLSFNCFLSTSKNRKISINFAYHATTNPDTVGILFVMTIDPSKSTTPFASIVDVSYFKGKEDEVLFAMNTVFHIRDIQSMDANQHLFQVELTFIDDNDKDLRQLIDCIREENFPDSEGWYRLGFVLLRMGQSDKAQNVYGILLKQATGESEKEPIYHQIGWAKHEQGLYSEAITFYEKALEIKIKTLLPNHSDLAASYNNIGLMYSDIGEYSKALSFCERAMKIGQQSLLPNHPHLQAY